MNRRSFSSVGLFSVVAAVFTSVKASSETETKTDGLFRRIYKQKFADILEHTTESYEASVAERKKKLFSRVKQSDTVADIGIGHGPNLKYLPKGVKVFGVEPNDAMWPYASEKADKYGINLSILDGVAEHIPLEDNSCDVVITTLTLCSVSDQEKAFREILRILKPGGEHLFIEHVVAPYDRPVLRGAQNFLNPLQVFVADGCHLNRDTGNGMKEMENPPYSLVEYDEFDADLGSFVDNINPIRPHICGYARKGSL